MGCTWRFLGLQWGHHRWRRRVIGYETFTRPASNMWARVVDEPYMRCDTEEICEVCGEIRHPRSCVCDLTRGETCKFRIDTMEEPGATSTTS